MKDERLLEVRNLKKYFPIEKGFLRRVTGQVKAVDDVSFFVNKGETLGLVGESGCGKTTLGRCVIRAYEPTEGRVFFDFDGGSLTDMTALDKRSLRQRRRFMQMIFQDPYSSLDPRMTVLDIVGEPLRYAGVRSRSEIEDRVKEIVKVVGLEVAHLKRYPHAFSGGQRQRIGIARALILQPRLVVCDEAVSALDVSIQAQILNLLQDLQEQFHLTYIFVAHNLSVVEHISDRTAVMYVGKMVELAATENLYTRPRHPYTEALLSAVPEPDPDTRMDRIILAGEVPNPANPPAGCPFHPRCRYAKAICAADVPQWQEVAPEHFTACHFAGELSLKGVQSTAQQG
jgi:peptide/nickel transport system ATP-binding protein